MGGTLHSFAAPPVFSHQILPKAAAEGGPAREHKTDKMFRTRNIGTILLT